MVVDGVRSVRNIFLEFLLSLMVFFSYWVGWAGGEAVETNRLKRSRVQAKFKRNYDITVTRALICLSKRLHIQYRRCFLCPS